MIQQTRDTDIEELRLEWCEVCVGLTWPLLTLSTALLLHWLVADRDVASSRTQASLTSPVSTVMTRSGVHLY